MLTPASSRPYIGGSQNISFWNVLFGYNGFGRLTGNETGSVGGGGNGQTGMWGPTGWLHMFNNAFGGQASWLIPAALLALVAGLIHSARRPRIDRLRASLVLWGGWLVLTGLVFSLSKGIIHEYYTVALAPAIGALVGIGAAHAWEHRDNTLPRSLLAIGVAITTSWSWKLLARTPNWHPWIRTSVIIFGIATTVLLAAWPSIVRRAASVIAVMAIVACLAGPFAYSVSTASVAIAGAIPTAGPAVTGARTGPGGGRPPGGQVPGGARSDGGIPDGGIPGGRPGGIGGLLSGSTPSAALTTLLSADSSNYTWIAATVGANQAAGYQLASGDPVMALGGFNGSDPTPTLTEFQKFVTAGKIHYFIAGGLGGPGGGGLGGGPAAASGNTTNAISSWVQSNFTATTVGGVPIYDLTTPTTS